MKKCVVKLKVEVEKQTRVVLPQRDVRDEILTPTPHQPLTVCGGLTQDIVAGIVCLVVNTETGLI